MSEILALFISVDAYIYINTILYEKKMSVRNNE